MKRLFLSLCILLSAAATGQSPAAPMQALLDSNLVLNSAGKASAFIADKRAAPAEPFFFYTILGLLLILALLKTFFGRYFTTLFRVFFNTTLRQNQLTDQLQQAVLPSLLFNSLFVCSAGLYLYLLFGRFSNGALTERPSFPFICILAVAACYAVKFVTLKFTGWVTNNDDEADIYIFIIFLVNKIIGVFLLPFLILIIFAEKGIQNFAITASLIMLGLMLLMRFLRSASLLRNRLKVSRLHFLFYVAGFELLPLALVCKAALNLSA